MMNKELQLLINPQASWHALKIGHQQNKVLLVDNFALNAQEIRQHAIECNLFNQETATYYPGLRAPLPPSLLHSVVAGVYPSLLQVYGFGETSALHEHASYYSLVSTAPEKLLPLQRIPHFDSTNERYLAIMLYLNEGDFGGTGFYRHRESGFESINEDNWPHFKALRENYQKQHGARPARYFTESDDEFELMGKIAYQANRLVVYPGNLLHSGLVTQTADLSMEPVTGRLTANIFVQFAD